MLWLNDLFTFILIGMGFGIFNMAFHWFINQRLAMKKRPAVKRRFLHFGSAVIGDKMNWVAIFIGCYLFALLQSWHLGVGIGRLYIEIALSVPQAFFMAFGLFIIDRIEFGFHFLFDPIETVPVIESPIPAQPNTPQVASFETVVSSAPPTRESFMGWIWRNKKEQLKATPSVISEKIGAVVAERAEVRAASKQAQEDRLKQEAEDRIKKFRDITDGH